MTERPFINRRWLFWIAVGFVFLLFLYGIRSILLPFVLGMGTAYFLDPAADRLEHAGLSRTLSTALITLCFFVVLALLLVLAVPTLMSQLSGLIASLPEYIHAFEERYSPQITAWIGTIAPEQMESIRQSVSNFSGVMVTVLGQFAGGLFQSGMAIINILSLILITPVVSFYLLRDWDRVVRRVDALLPRSHATVIRQQLAIIDQTLSGFIRGQLNVCLILGFVYAFGLSLVGLKFGIVIGVMTGLLAIIPFAGFTLGFIVALAVAFFQFETVQEIGGVVAVFMVGQVLESYFLTPNLVGDKVGLHPLWIIFGMLSGAALFGFVGVLLAIPVTAVIGVLIRFAIGRYLESEYYQGSGARGQRSGKQ